MTNYEKIKNMTVEEMANSCKACPLCRGIFCCTTEIEC